MFSVCVKISRAYYMYTQLSIGYLSAMPTLRVFVCYPVGAMILSHCFISSIRIHPVCPKGPDIYSDVDLQQQRKPTRQHDMTTTVIEHRKNKHRIQRVQELSLVKVHRPLPQGGYGRPSCSVWMGILPWHSPTFNMVHLEKRWFPKFGIFEIPLKLPCSGEITIP